MLLRNSWTALGVSPKPPAGDEARPPHPLRTRWVLSGMGRFAWMGRSGLMCLELADVSRDSKLLSCSGRGVGVRAVWVYVGQ